MNKCPKKIIGVSGLARSGKNLFTTVARKMLESHGLTTEEYALAYELKNDLKDIVKEKTGIDIFTEDTSQKNIIRPLLVAYGDMMRKHTSGKYWTSKLEEKIKKSVADVVFITDIRYDIYPEDECWWLKYKMNGKLIHITKYITNIAPSKRRISTSKSVKIYDGAPNDHEMLNNPKLKAKADYSFEWEDFTSKIENYDGKSSKYIQDIVVQALKQISVM